MMSACRDNRTARRRALLRQFAATEDKDVLPETKGFFERVKNYFTGQNEDE